MMVVAFFLFSLFLFFRIWDFLDFSMVGGVGSSVCFVGDGAFVNMP